MRTLLFLLLFTVTFLHAEHVGKHTLLPYDETMTLLKSIQNDAIVLGTGKTEVYVFIDPLCPYSRKFITRVSQDEMMLSKYKYYLFLYTIPRLKSEAMVSTIYASKKPIDLLLRVMVKHEDVKTDPVETTQKTVEEIAAVAHKIDVYKRPYLIVAKQK